VKYAQLTERRTIEVRCFTQTVVGGRVRSVTPYTRESIDWLAVYEATTDRCYYIPADELGDGKTILTLRLGPAANSQKAGIRLAEDYADLDSAVLRFDI